MEFNGIVYIDKPSHMTSFGVVARIRRILTQAAGKKVKVGHTGTLDPFATGLMILVVGKACKNAGEFSKLDKVYEATFHLGETSSTGDPEGEIRKLEDTRGKIGIGELKKTLERFVGEITQTPPIFSAIKIHGVRAYKLARAHQEIEMPERLVSIYSLELLAYTYPEVKIRVHVSSGTYIRSLVSDLGQALGTGAYTTELRRTRIKDWDLSVATTTQAFTPDKVVAIS